MVDTIKFSQMTNAGNINNDDIMPSLRSGENVILNNPWTFLPPGDTASRPAPSSTINYRLRFNTEEQLYEYYDAVLGQWTQLQESLFTQGPFVIYTADPSIPDGQNLGILSDGILKQTITAGVATIDIAVNGTDFYGPGYTGYINAPAGIADINGNPIVNTVSAGASAVNYLRISNNITGNGPSISAVGSDTNIALSLSSKGAGPIGLITQAINQALFIYSGTSNQHLTRFSFADTAADRIVTWPDASGTVAFGEGTVASLQGTENQVLVNGTFGTPVTGTDIILTTPQDIGTSSSPTFDNLQLSGGLIVGSDGTTVFELINTALSVNYIRTTSQPTGSSPSISARGTDTNISLTLAAKGTGNIALVTGALTQPLLIYSGTSNQHLTRFNMADTAADRSITFQDASGTLAFLSDLTGFVTSVSGTANRITSTGGTTPVIDISASYVGQSSITTLGTIGTGVWQGTVIGGTYGGTGVNNGASTITLGGSLSTIGAFTADFTMTANTAVTFPISGTLATTSQLPTPSALTKTDDTNVTLTLGGSPSTALLAATSLTLGWAGQLSGARGGTGVANTGLTINLGSAATGYLLTSDSSGNATWQAPAYLTGAVLLTPSGNQTITVGGLIVNAGPFIGGTSAGSGVAGSIQLYNAAASAGNFQLFNSTVSSFTTRLTNSAVGQFTTITFPDPGSGSASVAYTSTASGIVNSGSQNQLAWYAANGTTLSGLSTANNGVLITSAGGVPSISSTLPSGIAATNMALTTPNIGVATATSITFGGTALNNYTQGTFTPTFTCGTPGDLSVSYAAQEGAYTRIGRLVQINYSIQFTPTFTTATGVITFGGLPTASAGNNSAFAISTINNGWTWPVGKQIVPNTNSGTTNVLLQANATNANTANCSIETTLVSGVQVSITFSGVYYV